jgi:hypothetical protein
VGSEMCISARNHPAPWPWQWRRRRAYERWLGGLCVECGYDLRAGTEKGGALLPRCPECGAPARVGAPVASLENR